MKQAKKFKRYLSRGFDVDNAALQNRTSRKIKRRRNRKMATKRKGERAPTFRSA